MAAPSSIDSVPDDGPLMGKKRLTDDYVFDITAMIDLVFMMNIFFLVTSIADSMSQIDLPLAEHPRAAEVDTCLMVTIKSQGENRPAAVYVGEGSEEQLLPEGKEQEKQLRELVETAMESGKKTLLIKAERRVLHRDVSRVASVAAVLEGVKLNLAVLEFED
jgi:biopolymer transport protein ExbD